MDTHFAPHLTIKVLKPAVEFYQAAFHANTIRTWDNPDGSIHVAEMTLDDCIFHLHEETARAGQFSPGSAKCTTVLIGLFLADPDEMFQRAIAAGATVVSDMQSYDYGYRQGTLADPFGHQWLLQKRI